jgi:hypothetical protein
MKDLLQGFRYRLQLNNANHPSPLVAPNFAALNDTFDKPAVHVLWRKNGSVLSEPAGSVKP